MVEDRAQCQTEAAMRRQQGIAGHVRSHLTLAPDAVGQDREHRTACGALDSPDREPTEPDTDVMGVACQDTTLAAAGLVEELQAEGEKEGEDELDKRLGIAHEGKVSRL